jgi:uncharacterized protein YggE
MLRILSWLIVLAAVPCAGAQTRRVDTLGDRSTLVVTATGEGEVVPDRATLGINIESQARTGSEATAGVALIHTRIIDTLRALGFSPPSVTTVNYGVSSFQPPSRPVVHPATGLPVEGERPPVMFVARGSIRVEITRLEELNLIASAALAQGATGIATPSFSSSNADSARRAAIVKGTRQAQAEAGLIAQTLGGSLGKLIELTSNASMGPRFRQQQPTYFDSGPAVAGVALRAGGATTGPGEMVFTAHVTMRWEFLPGQ